MNDLNVHASGDELTEIVDPRYYVWVVCGQPHAGILVEYASDYVRAHYHGEPITGLWEFRQSPQNGWYCWPVTLKSEVRNDLDAGYRYITFTANGEKAWCRIDLRA